MKQLLRHRRGLAVGLTLISTLFISTIAQAQESRRPLTRQLSCAQARTLVVQQGAIVLSTDTYLYDRYVNSAQFCPRGQSVKPAWTPTKDSTNCFIGYTCVEAELDYW